MCYSAPVSFALAGVLAVIGALAIARNKYGSRMMFASVPLLFAAQQAAEGMVWLTHGGSQYVYITSFATYIFLFFALVVWPCWVPLSLWMMEKNPSHKKILKSLCLLGALYGLYSLGIMMFYGASTDVVGHSICYRIIGYNNFWIVDVAMYLVAAVLPFFVSSIPGVWILGSTITGALIFTYYFLQATLISVWCFFAAALSIMILWIL